METAGRNLQYFVQQESIVCQNLDNGIDLHLHNYRRRFH
jgi:hypothetical protein